MILQVFENEFNIQSEQQLRMNLSYRYKEKYAAFWIGEKQLEYGLFINDNYSCIYYMPQDGSGQISSKSSRKNSSNENEICFYLENYQLNFIPETMVIDTNIAVESMVYFFKTGKLSEKIEWE